MIELATNEIVTPPNGIEQLLKEVKINRTRLFKNKSLLVRWSTLKKNYRYLNSGASQIIIDWSYEPGIDPGELAAASQELEENFSIKPQQQIWILNHAAWPLSGINAKVMFVDYFLAQTLLYPAKHSVIPSSLYQRPFNGLCLTGKLRGKPWRCQQLWDFYNYRDLWQHMTVSTLGQGPKTGKIYSRQFVKDLSAKKALNTLTIAETNHGTSSHGWPAPWDYYQRTRASFVQETIDPTDHSSRFITEKTYRAMVCGHAFVSSGGESYRNRLRDMGFKLFEPLIPRHYDNSQGVVLAELFYSLLENYQAVEADVAANQQLIAELALQESAKMQKTFFELIND